MKFFCVVVLAAILPSAFGAEADASGRTLTSLERLQPEHLRAAHEARLQFARDRTNLPNLGIYEDFRAVIHVHAEDSNHTPGTRQQVLDAAKQTGVRVVMFTDHGGPGPNTWHGRRDGVLFLSGGEDTGRGELRFPSQETSASTATNELKFLSHVEERYGAATDGFDGVEICNRHTDAKLDPGLAQYFRQATNDPAQWKSLVENFQKFPDEIFAASSDYHPEILAKWDSEIQKKPLTGIGANDSHQNQIFGGTTFDPYEVSFRNLSTHILARALTEPEIRQALREGHAYVAHDWLCDPTGFAFGGVNTLGVYPMGDSIPLLGVTRLGAVVPVSARLKLFQDGKKIHEQVGTNLLFTVRTPGAYRLEAWLPVDGEERPWIISNPVYLRAANFSSFRLPSAESATNVVIEKNISYVSGRSEDEEKHRLDLYIPSDKTNAPVLIFLHGGAWRFGDRSQYLALGNRFAREGILTVVPSYRLAPKNPYPAQIEDAADAFAWVARHIAQHGGDPSRIYVGGHSAGGHLAALLALNERYLRLLGLSSRNIRGVICISGVFDVEGNMLANVFGNEQKIRRDASPLQHVSSPAPPFLVFYCQWDYLTLPAQARTFHAALRAAGVLADLIFIPRENHISEIISTTYRDDPTAAAILRFVR